jgi:HAE1 family hydrophobic/amphiphilic exporter-1
VVRQNARQDAHAAADHRRRQRSLGERPQLKITINRDQASRFGISPQLIDDTLNDAFGQRQITQYYTQLKTYFVVLEILPELQKDLSTLNRLYVKSPLTGGAVPLSSLVDVDSSKVGMLSVAHQGQFPAVTLTFNLRPGVALGQAVDAISEAAREIKCRRRSFRPSRATPGVPELARPASQS